MRVKGLKTYSNPIKKCAQKEVWVVNGTLNDMSSFQLSAKSHKKSDKNQSPLVQVWNFKLVQNVDFKWKFA